MLETFQKIWKFAGDERDNINKSIVFCFINAVFGMFEIAAVYTEEEQLLLDDTEIHMEHFRVHTVGEYIRKRKWCFSLQQESSEKRRRRHFPSWSRPTRVILWREIRELQLEIS